MLVIKTKDRPSPTWYAYNTLFDHIGGTLLSCLPPKSLHTLKYFDLYSFLCHMGTEQVQTGLALNRCHENERDRNAVRDRAMCYGFSTGKAYCLSEDEIQAKKGVMGVDGAPSTVPLASVPVTSRVGVSHIDIPSTR